MTAALHPVTATVKRAPEGDGGDEPDPRAQAGGADTRRARVERRCSRSQRTEPSRSGGVTAEVGELSPSVDAGCFEFAHISRPQPECPLYGQRTAPVKRIPLSHAGAWWY